jgi:hypothetical protein
MSFRTTETTLSAAVATSGTFTVSYPAGTQAGSFAGAHGHRMWANGHQKTYVAPDGFSLSFGASSITVTYLGTTSLQAGSRVRLQLDLLGDDDRAPEKALTLVNVKKANVVLLDLGSPITLDADGIAASQTVTGAGTAFVINGALASNAAVDLDVPRNVVAAWTNTAILTITGKDVDGNTVVEKSASGTSHTGKKAFKRITSVTTSATVTSATVGTGVVIGLPRYVPDASYILAELKNGVSLPRRPGMVVLTGTILEANVDTPLAYNFVSPVAGVIRKLSTVASATVTTGGAFTVEVNTVAVTGLTVTVANSAAAGEIDSGTATLGHATSVVAVGDLITVTPGAAFSGAADFSLILEIDTSAAGQLTGTFVAGVTSAATATTGDTRGTYSPLTAPDGTAGYQLLVALPDPANKGVAQYAG